MKLLNTSGGVNNDNHQSQVINTMRFPLITLVVLFHLYPPEEVITSQYTSYNIISTFFSANGIARLAVPTFFLISGYFFYYHLKKWDSSVYTSKLRKRIKTLLIPYLLWNGIPVLGIIIARCLIGMTNGSSLSMIKEFGDSISWLRAFWDCGTVKGHPFDVPLWYIRDLMVCSICSPIIYYLIRKTGMIYILLIGCLYLTNTWINIAGFDARAWFFFSFGAYLSLNNINMVCLLRRYAIIIIPIAITLLVITTYYNHVLTDIQPILNNIFLLFGVTALIGGFSYLVSKVIVRDIPFLTKSVFFIYAFHVLPLPGIPSITTLCKNLAEKSIVETQILTYFMQLTLCPIAVLSACLITYYFMRRLTPKLLSVLTGQR